MLHFREVTEENPFPQSSFLNEYSQKIPEFEKNIRLPINGTFKIFEIFGILKDISRKDAIFVYVKKL
jgi:hypothetical protein